MANIEDRTPENVPGRFYVDSTCIDCDLCRSTAPDFFRRHDEIGLSIVFRQPVAEEEIQLAEEALEDCPTNSIGNDGAVHENETGQRPSAPDTISSGQIPEKR